jgi:AcrR family transcriptional regulator
MATQDRALRTRRALIRAAAAQFNQDGYHGAALSQICRAAGISMGALTFHFSSKGELADAIAREGWATTRTVVERVAHSPQPALQRAVGLTLELTRLLEEDPLVRCAVRLSRERPGHTQWAELWLPLAHRLAAQAHAEGQLNTEAAPGDITLLISLFVGGAEAGLRSTQAAAYDSAVGRLERSWQLVLEGIAPATDTPPP